MLRNSVKARKSSKNCNNSNKCEKMERKVVRSKKTAFETNKYKKILLHILKKKCQANR